MSDVHAINLGDAVAAALEKLLTAAVFDRGVYVTLPIRYPSGASVVLQITEVGDRCFVTDYGMGYVEADMLGATNFFERRARTLAEATGIHYDGQSFFIAEVGKDRLAGAMVVVADCSQKAANQAAMSTAKKDEAAATDEAFEKIASVFGRQAVARDVPFKGASSHQWSVAFMVTLPSRDKAVFEAPTNHGQSISSTAVKFVDIGRLDSPPPRIAVVRSKIEMGDYLGVLAPISTAVLEISEGSRRFQMAIAA
jgi:hypothetical protein